MSSRQSRKTQNSNPPSHIHTIIDMIHGKDLILTIDSQYNQTKALAASKSCEVDVNTDFIETASPTDGAWKQFTPTIL